MAAGGQLGPAGPGVGVQADRGRAGPLAGGQRALRTPPATGLAACSLETFDVQFKGTGGDLGTAYADIRRAQWTRATPQRRATAASTRSACGRGRRPSSPRAGHGRRAGQDRGRAGVRHSPSPRRDACTSRLRQPDAEWDAARDMGSQPSSQRRDVHTVGGDPRRRRRCRRCPLAPIVDGVRPRTRPRDQARPDLRAPRCLPLSPPVRRRPPVAVVLPGGRRAPRTTRGPRGLAVPIVCGSPFVAATR